MAHGVGDRDVSLIGNEATARESVAPLAESLAAVARDVDAIQRLRRVAERHGHLPRDSPLARELVFDAITDLLLGEAKHDPRATIDGQVERQVRRRANRLRKIKKKRRQRGAAQPDLVPLDEAPASALLVEPPQERLEDEEHSVPDAADLVAWIWEHARGDGSVIQLLALCDRDDSGLLSRRAAARCGMTEWVYRAARQRLETYAKQAIAAATATPLPSQSAEVQQAPLAGLPSLPMVEPSRSIEPNARSQGIAGAR